MNKLGKVNFDESKPTFPHFFVFSEIFINIRPYLFTFPIPDEWKIRVMKARS